MSGIPNLNTPRVETVRLSVEQIRALPDDALLKLLSGEALPGKLVPAPIIQLINAELMARTLKRASRPHWTVTPSFIAALIAAVAGCVAAWPVLFPAPAQQPVPQAQQSATTKQPHPIGATTFQPQSRSSTASPQAATGTAQPASAAAAGTKPR